VNLHCFGTVLEHFIILGFFGLFSKFVIMNLASLGQVFLIWMLLSVTLGNCATSKFKVHNVLANLDGSIIRFNVFPMFLTDMNGRRHPSRFWWKEPRQYTHWEPTHIGIL
jgi:hypothetical protein